MLRSIQASRVRGAAFLLASCLLFAGAGRASALTLFDLDCLTGSCQSFAAGSLQFESFNVYISGDLDPDLTQYEVSVLPDGFHLTGPLHASAGEFGDLVLTYDVSSPAGIPGATLAFSAVAAGGQAFSSVSEDFLGDDPHPIASLFVAVGPGISILSDSTTFDPAPESLHVIKDIIVSGLNGSTAIDYVDQTYPTPAPAASGLLGLGLAGLWRFGRRRPS